MIKTQLITMSIWLIASHFDFVLVRARGDYGFLGEKIIFYGEMINKYI